MSRCCMHVRRWTYDGLAIKLQHTTKQYASFLPLTLSSHKVVPKSPHFKYKSWRQMHHLISTIASSCRRRSHRPPIASLRACQRQMSDRYDDVDHRKRNTLLLLLLLETICCRMVFTDERYLHIQQPRSVFSIPKYNIRSVFNILSTAVKLH